MISSQCNRRIASNYLLYRGRLLRNGVVEIDSTGKVLSVGSAERIDSLCNTEFFSGLLTAGWVNAHCHLELSHLRGTISERCGFASFARQLSSVRESFDQTQQLRAMAQADLDMSREGVVAVGDIANSPLSMKIKRQSAIHYHTFAEHFGLGRDSWSHLEELLAEPQCSLTPHSTYSVQDKVFRSIAALEQDAPLSIHFMETAGESKLFEGRGELHEWYAANGMRCDFLHYGSPAERIIRSVPRERSVLLVHNVMVQQRDVEMIMNHFTAPVYWVVCPRSNDYISGQRPPVELLRSMGLNICVGTDSLSSNHSLSLLEEIGTMREVPLEERLQWVTKGGAAALRVGNCGEVEVDKRPGLVRLSGIDFETGQIGKQSKIERIV